MRSQIILRSQCITDAKICSQLDVELCPPEHHHQEVHQSWYEVPDDQTVNTHDATDRVVGNVEDCKDNVEEGEEKTNKKHDDNGDKHSFPNHVWLWLKTIHIDITRGSKL